VAVADGAINAVALGAATDQGGLDGDFGGQTVAPIVTEAAGVEIIGAAGGEGETGGGRGGARGGGAGDGQAHGHGAGHGLARALAIGEERALGLELDLGLVVHVRKELQGRLGGGVTTEAGPPDRQQGEQEGTEKNGAENGHERRWRRFWR
jgi:hypothetical protein